MVQWLRLCAPNAGDLGLIPGQGTRSHILQLKDLAWCNGDWRCQGLQLRPSTAKYINNIKKKPQGKLLKHADCASSQTPLDLGGILVSGTWALFPVVMYGCRSWTIKKAEHKRIDAFKLWCWRRLLRVPWTARRSNHSILKEINPEYSLEGLMLKLKLHYFGHLMPRATSL